MGEHQASLTAQVEGEPGGAVFNYRYLLDGLTAVGGQEVFLQLTGESTPSAIRPVDSQDYVYVIMPIRQ